MPTDLTQCVSAGAVRGLNRRIPIARVACDRDQAADDARAAGHLGACRTLSRLICHPVNERFAAQKTLALDVGDRAGRARAGGEP